MGYFWYTEADIPAGIGFELFGTAHRTVMLTVLLAVVTVASIYNKVENCRRRILIVVSFLLPVTELLKILFLIKAQKFGIGYLPMHLCSLSIFIYPVYTMLKQGKIKDFAGCFCCCVLLPAAVSAIVFPDWTMYPVISFMSLSSFVWHTLQIILPICLCVSGEVRPGFKDAVKCLIFLCMLAVPVYIFDRVYSCNYWFLLNPVPGPLEMLYSSFGYILYLPALTAFVGVIVVSAQKLIAVLQHLMHR